MTMAALGYVIWFQVDLWGGSRLYCERTGETMTGNELLVGE